MADLSGFDATKVDPKTAFTPVPAGRYVAVIIESKNKPNKAGTGTYLEFTFQVVEGQFKGRLVWTRLNLQHITPKVVELARAELSSICHAAGVLRPKDSRDLHNRPMTIVVSEKSGPDGSHNEIKDYIALSSAANGGPA